MCVYHFAQQRARQQATRYSLSCANPTGHDETARTEINDWDEQLTDPTYQLLVCHTILCRQLEYLFEQPASSTPAHRKMRAPV